MIDEEEEGKDGDKKPKASAVGKVMGSNMERPIGNKKAKALRAAEALGDGSLASTQAMEAMARSSAAMADIMAKRQRHDSWSKRAELYMKMGQEDKAMEILGMMEEDDKKPAALPRDITVQEPDASSEEEEEVEEVEEDQHPNRGGDGGSSQLSSDDDSKLVKKHAV